MSDGLGQLRGPRRAHVSTCWAGRDAATPASATSSWWRCRTPFPAAAVKKGEVAKGVIDPDPEGAPPQGRLLHPLRPERHRPDRRQQRAEGHPHLRAGGSRAARQTVHEDHLPGAGGHLTAWARMHIAKGDTVVVIAGDDKGKIGQVLKVFPEAQRVIVEKVNFVKRHTKPTQKTTQGGIVEKEAPIHISNVMLVDPRRATRRVAGIRRLDDGRRERLRQEDAASRSRGPAGDRGSRSTHEAAGCRKTTTSGSSPALMKQVPVLEHDAGAPTRQDRGQHGRGRRHAERQASGRGGRRT